MRFKSARQAWNQAFSFYGPGIDYKNIRSDDSKLSASDAFWNNAERGVIIAAVHSLRASDPTAYCWGMIAYTDGLEVTTERTVVEWYLLEEFEKARPKFDIEANRRSISILADQALADAIKDDNRAEDGKPCRKSREHFVLLAKRMGIEYQVFRDQFRRHYDCFRDLALALPGRALRGVGSELERRIKATPEHCS